MRTNEERFEALPKWAQAKIRKLEFDRDMALAKVEERDAFIAGQAPDTNVMVQAPEISGDDRPLPINSQIRFYLTPERRFFQMISVRHDRRNPAKLVINSSGGRVMVTPDSSNQIKVWIEER